MNRCVALGGIVPGCLGRTYRDVHHALDQLGCGAGQEGDGLGEPPHGISIITTLPRPRYGDCLFIVYIVDDTRSHMFFSLDVMDVVERPEKHLVSMSLPHSRNDLVGSLPILCPPLHALSKSGSSL